MREMTESPHPLVGDLVHVPSIRTVIQLLDSRSADRRVRGEIFETFVVTDEIAGFLRQFLDALLQSHGAGAFLKGHYGSGKSHFLSFLSMLIAQGDGRGAPLPDSVSRKLDALSGKRFFTVLIPLFLFNAGEGLDEIVLVSCQKALEKSFKRRVTLSRSTRMLESFTTYVLPQAPAFLDGLSLDESTWRALCIDSPAVASEKAIAYLATLPENPLNLHYDRREAFEAIGAELQNGGFDGLVLIIDELSEFLKSKPSAHEFNEDVRFLQFLGEWSAHEPLWTIASLQESIEEVGHIEGDLYRRIKDRYGLRFSLTTRHIEDLIEKRVLVKREGSRAAIDGVYRKLLASFPHLKISSDYFYKIYPLHPATLETLEHLMGLFSQHRGVVDFLRITVGGDGERGIPSHLGEPCDRLLTCDAIFDHFQEKIRETVEIAPYYNVAYRSLKEDIERLFELERDRKIALKMVKIMILAELSPLEKRRTAAALADLVVERVSAIDSAGNYDYVREVILDRLVRETGYVGKEQQPDDVWPRYFIDLTANMSQLVLTRTREILRTLEMDAFTWRAILSLANLPNLPLAEHLEGKSGPDRFYMKWENTARVGWILISELTGIMPGELEHLERSLHTSEEDFIFLAGFPCKAEEQLRHLRNLFNYVKDSRFARAIVAWIPAVPDGSEREALSTTYAHTLLRARCGGSPEDREVAEHLDELLLRERAHLREIISRLYFEGSIYRAAGELSSSPAEIGFVTLQALVSRLMGPSLESIYPRHREIKPLSDAYSQPLLEKTASLLFHEAKLSAREAQEKGVLAVIESVFVPMGLARRTQAAIVMTADPSKSPLLQEISGFVTGGKPALLDNIYLKLRKGPFGIIRPLFNTAVAALIQSGLLMPYNEGIPVSSPSLRKLSTFEISAVGEGKLIDSEAQKLLPRASFIWGDEVELAPFTLVVQRNLWDKAVAALKTLGDRMRRLREALGRVSGYGAASILPLAQIEERIAAAEDFVISVPSSLDSRRGLEKLLDEIEGRPELPQVCGELEKHLVFLQGEFETFQRLHGFMTSPSLVIPREGSHGKMAEQKRTLLGRLAAVGEMVTMGKTGALFEETQHFIREYTDSYCAAHKEFYSHPHFKEWQALRESKELTVLRRLSRLYGLEVSADAIKMQQLLDGLPVECRRKAREELVLGARCPCGFRLGDTLQGTSPEALRDFMVRGIGEYHGRLSEPPRKEKIEIYAAGLRDMGRRDLAKDLEKILLRRSLSAYETMALFSEDVVEALYRALFTKLHLVERNIDHLCEELKGRRFPPVRLRERFEQWLSPGDLPASTGGDETMIHVISPQSADRFSLWEGYEPAREIIGEEGHRFLSAFWSVFFLHQSGTAHDSIYLSSRFRIDRGRLDELSALGMEVLQTHRRFDDILRAEKALLDEGGAEDFLGESGVEAADAQELTLYLRKDRAFPFMARRAAQRLLASYDGLEDEGTAMAASQVLDHSCAEAGGCWEEAPLLRCFLTVRQKILESERASGHDALQDYVEIISPLAYSLEELRSRQFRADLLSEPSMRAIERRCREVFKSHRERFHDYISQGLAPSVKTFLSGLFAPLRSMNRDRPVFIIIFDAMRVDFWHFIKADLQDIFMSHELREHYLVAMTPSDTATNRPCLLGISPDESQGTLEGESFVLVSAAEKVAKRGRIDEFMTAAAPIRVLNFNFIDDRIHHSATPLAELYEGLRAEFAGSVAPHLRKIPRDSLLFVISDHGFDYSHGRKRPYSHGGASPAELVVPCAAFVPGACGGA